MVSSMVHGSVGRRKEKSRDERKCKCTIAVSIHSNTIARKTERTTEVHTVSKKTARLQFKGINNGYEGEETVKECYQLIHEHTRPTIAKGSPAPCRFWWQVALDCPS